MSSGIEVERHNDNNVYILGAGFSAEGGLPIIRTFTNTMRDAYPWLKSNGYEREALAIDRLFEFRLKAASAAERIRVDLENIEELFSLAAAAAGKSLTEKITLAIAGTLVYAERKASPASPPLIHANKAWKPPQHWQRQGEFRGGEVYGYQSPTFEYYMLSLVGYPNEQPPDRSDTIITLNYDTLVEDALHGAGIPFIYGFAEGTVTLDGSARSAASPPLHSAVPMLKLHGSVNWAVEDGRLTVYGTYNDVRGKKLSPLLVPPTWRKSAGEEVLEIWDSAVQALRTATRVIIMGYSMPRSDQHFKYLLAAGLQQNISLREIWFVNENASSLEASVFDVLRADLSPNVVKPLRTANRRAGEFITSAEQIGRGLGACFPHH